MNEIIQNLEANATNGYENFCYISENKLNVIKELSKREYAENQQLKEDVQFCLHSIVQEMNVSTDERTRKEMRACYNILKKYKGDNK